MRILLLGRGHIGSAVERELSARHEVLALTRSTTPAVDITEPASVESVLSSHGPFDAVVNCIGHVPFGRVGELAAEDYEAGFRGKVLSQIVLTKLAERHLTEGGSITLTTGVLARYPIAGGTVASMANGAVEAFVMAASPELRRGIRLNAVSPTMLEEATSYASAFPGVVPVSSHRVAMAYARSIDGIQTGQIFAVE